MRRSLALLAALAVTLALTTVPAEAAYTSRLRAVRLLSPGATTKIEVEAESLTDISEVRAVLRLPVEEPRSVPVDDFELVEGTAKDGVWRTRSAVTVEQGRWLVDIEVTNAEETRLLPGRAMIDNGADTVLTDFEVSPTTVDIEHPEVTFRARLLRRDASGDLSPLAGEPVHMTQPNGQVVKAVTGTDGRAQGTASFTTSGHAELRYGGDFIHRPAKTAATPITKERLKTRLTMNMPDQLIVGEEVTVTGRLERQDRNGVWAPLAGKQLDLQFDRAVGGDWHTIATPRTDAGGNYSVPVTISANGSWAVLFANDPRNLPDDYYGYETSSARTGRVRQVTHRTSVSGFNAAPEPAGLGSTIRIYGTVMWTMADGRQAPADGGTVRLQFSTDGKTWRNKDTQALGGDGKFHFESPAERDGYWRAVVPDDDGYLVLPSVSHADHVDVKYRTHMHKFNASPEPVKKGGTITVKGLLYRYVPKGEPGPGARIQIYFKTKSASSWTLMAETKTGKDGWFRKTFTASKDGYWMAAYPGSSTYMPSNKPGDYVDVR